jgi:ABC-2 type transport system ATP-binding protein
MGDAQAGTALAVEGITKRYGEFTAVDGLSFRVPRGCIFGILGPNGAGKTTTLRMINDILAPDEGRIRILDGLSPGRQAAARIGYLPEERGLYPKMRVLDTLQFFGELRGLGGREARDRGAAWLERLDVASWRDNKIQDLSKGMQQKVQFAAALLHEPELLILDEPWSGLDPINADVLRDIVLEQKAAGRTILFSTHLMEQAEQICDRVCIIARGAKVLDGALDAVKREAAGGRLIALRLADADDEAARAAADEAVLADEAVVTAVRRRRDYLEVELVPGDAAEVAARADALLARLVGAGIGVRRFELIEPTLHEIFVGRVGQVEQAGQVASGEEALS